MHTKKISDGTVLDFFKIIIFVANHRYTIVHNILGGGGTQSLPPAQRPIGRLHIVNMGGVIIGRTLIDMAIRGRLMFFYTTYIITFYSRKV